MKLLLVFGLLFAALSCTTQPKQPVHDYKLDIHRDTITVYDSSGRFVAQFVNTKWDSKLDSIILEDNQ